MSREERGHHLADLLASPELRRGLADADVVIGVDLHDPECTALFFGRSVLGRAVDTGRVATLRVVRVVIDFASDDSETLEAACVAARGSSSFQGGTDLLPPRADLTGIAVPE